MIAGFGGVFTKAGRMPSTRLLPEQAATKVPTANATKNRAFAEMMGHLQKSRNLSDASSV
jgi:hypothetical protein